MRVPSYMYERLGTWQEAYGQLQSKLGREPRIDEFAEHMKSSPEQAWAIHWAMQRSWSNNGKEAAILPEVAPDQKMPSAAEVAAWRDDLRQMKILLQKMDERAALILRLRYGLSGEEPMTLNDVGARIGVTRERVRQIEMEALTELQVCLSERNPQREMRKMQSRRGREGRSWMASA